MAARSEIVAENLEFVDLRRLTGRELDPLLLQETFEWSQSLDWDFSRSAELVRHFADVRGLTGAGLLNRGEVIGYGYAVLEDHKGLIGDLYVLPEWRNGVTDVRLFRMLFDALLQTPGLRRIECQLMLLAPSVGAALQTYVPIRIYDRLLMSLDCASPPHFPAAMNPRRFRLEQWADHYYEPAAGVITTAYAHHVDSDINDQYRSIPGARRFLYNIVQFPSCGAFFKTGSFVAIDQATGWLSGIVMVSFVGPETGHITQLCVTPAARGAGVGYELLRRGMLALQQHGARRISLTVTAANQDAIGLYKRCGFVEKRHFPACVWDSNGDQP